MAEPVVRTPHRSLRVLEMLFDTQPPPEPAELDADGAWEHRYAVVVIEPVSGGESFKNAKLGWLHLRREPADGGVRLVVDQGIEHGGRIGHTRAEIQCAADELATPQRWTLSTELRGLQDGGIVPYSRMPAVQGEVRDGRIHRRVGADGATRTWPAPARWTANWCLFDALQRLHDPPLAEFDLFEELEPAKPRHRVVARPPCSFSWGGREMTLRGFDQIGHGLLPYTWWLDESGRAVLAVGSQRAFVWDPGAGVEEAGG